MKYNISNLSKGTVRILAAAIAGGAMLTGCADMDLTPTYQPTSESVWQDVTMASQAATGPYRCLRYRIADNAQWGVTTWQCFSSALDRDPNWRGYKALFGNLDSSDGDCVLPVWAWHMEYAAKANAVVANIMNVPGIDQDEAARMRAENIFLRAYWYYEMNIIWGGIPYIREEVTDPEQTYIARLSKEETWDELIKDFTEVINTPSLPDKYAQGDGNWGHITKGTAYAYRGKCYMWKKEWQKAADDFQKVKDCGYKLLTAGDRPYIDLFKEAQEQCDEMMFTVCFGPQDTQGNVIWRNCATRSVNGKEGWNNWHGNPAMIESYENADGSKFSWDQYIPGYSSKSKKARQAYFLRDDINDDEIAKAVEGGADMSLYIQGGNEARLRPAFENRDPRLEQTFITPYSIFNGARRGFVEPITYRFPFRTDGADDRTTPFLADLLTDTGMETYLMRKFVAEGQEVTKWYSSIDYPILRYGEVLCDWAECLAELGDLSGSADKINELRARVGHVLLNSNANTMVAGKEDMIERARMEHYYELAGEENLFFDELRWGTWRAKKFYQDSEGQMNGLKKPWGVNYYEYVDGGDKMTEWPVPDREMQVNHNMNQSPYWK